MFMKIIFHFYILIIKWTYNLTSQTHSTSSLVTFNCLNKNFKVFVTTLIRNRLKILFSWFYNYKHYRGPSCFIFKGRFCYLTSSILYINIHIHKIHTHKHTLRKTSSLLSNFISTTIWFYSKANNQFMFSPTKY
jgi:hypothetical protein